MSLTSVELNYLIWRYLTESGHDLAAYALQKQSRCLENENIPAKAVPPGALATMVQRGILYSLAEDAAAGKTEGLVLAHALAAPQLVLEAAAALPASPDTSLGALDAEARPAGPAAAAHKTKPLACAAVLAPALAALWNPSGTGVVCGQEEGSATVYQLQQDGSVPATSHSTLNHTAMDGAISTVTWNDAGIATAGMSGEVRAWLPDGRLRNIANSATDPTRVPGILTSLLWCPHNQLVLTVDVFNTISVWNGSTWTLLTEIRTAEAVTPVVACWVGDLKFAASTGKNAIKIYSISHAGGAVTVVGQLAGHAHVVLALSFSEVSKLLASASDTDYAIKVWNSLLPAEALELNVVADKMPHVHYHRAPVVGLFWLARAGDVEGNQLVSVSMEGVVNVWDAFLGDVLVLVNVFHNPDNFHFDADVDVVLRRSLVFNAAVSPDLTLLAIGDDVGNVSLWDVNPQHYAETRDLLRCVGIYAVNDKQAAAVDSGDAGICDLVWDPLGKRLCVCYKGSDSVILDAAL